MGSVCISTCLDDINNRAPTRVRATYVNLHRWPESDAEFVRSLSFQSSSSAGSGPGHYPAPKVVDSISCRQMYLRSYTFTRKESVNEKTKKCIGKVKDKVMVNGKTKKKKEEKMSCNEMSSCSSEGKKKGVPCAALKSLFRKLLLCSTSVDVVS